MRFVPLEPWGEWVAIEEIGRIVAKHNGKGKRTTFLLFDKEGRALGETSVDLSEMDNAIIPAAPGQIAAMVWVTFEGEVGADLYHVVGWRIVDDVAVAIIPESIVGNGSLLLQQPDGSFVDPENARFDDLEQAKASILDQHKRKKEAPQP